jgi:hypothetical protein
MQTTEMIRCRVAACREALGGRNEWNFYLINDSAPALDSATLMEVGYRTIDTEFKIPMNASVTDLAPGASVLIWRGNSNGPELIELSLDVRILEREVRLRFEFPILNIQKYWTLVDALGKLCWLEAAEA